MLACTAQHQASTAPSRPEDQDKQTCPWQQRPPSQWIPAIQAPAVCTKGTVYVSLAKTQSDDQALLTRMMP